MIEPGSKIKYLLFDNIFLKFLYKLNVLKKEELL